jgi:hypothetical protein
MHRNHSGYLTGTPRVSVASDGIERPHSPYITQQNMLLQTSKKKKDVSFATKRDSSSAAPP